MVKRARAWSLIIMRAVFGLAFVGVALTFALYLFGRKGKPEEPSAEPTLREVASNVLVRGEGFHFELMDGNRRVFMIEGKEQVSDREGLMSLQDVRIEVDRDDGIYGVRADRAYYEPDSQAARLQGAVRLQGPEGLWMEAERLEVAEQAESMVAREGALFGAEGQLTGRADLMEASLGSSEFTLTGNVEIESLPGQSPAFVMRAGLLSFHQERGFGRAEGGVWMESEGSTLQGERLDLNLDPLTGEVSFLRILYSVSGNLLTNPTDPSSRPLELEGTSLTLRFDPETGETTEMELRGTPGRPAIAQQTRSDRTHLAMQAITLQGSFRAGSLTHALLDGRVEMSEVPLDEIAATRHLEAERGEARFDADGEVVGLSLDGDVKLRDGDLTATAERALFEMEEGEVELFGDPVRIDHPRGNLQAGKLRYLQDMSMIHGQDGITALLNEEGGSLSVAGQEGAVRVIADETFWLTDPDGVLFSGSVRAWQGNYALLADQLRGDEAEGRMSAAGGVRTLWNPSAEDDMDLRRESSSESEEGEEEGGEATQRPLEVKADELVYREAERLLTYRGSVRAGQAGSSLQCDELGVALDEENEAERLECTGNILVEDLESGLSLAGTRALYDLGIETVDVFGEPIEIKDAVGEGAAGVRALTYRFEDESLLLRSDADEDSAEGDT